MSIPGTSFYDSSLFVLDAIAKQSG